MSLSEEQLRERLFEAANCGADSTLADLCRTYRDEIVAAYPRWQRVPDSLRNDPHELQRYGQALMGLAQFFATYLGDARLFQLLERPSADRALGRARELMSGLQFEEALALLRPALAEAGPLRAMVVGAIGEACFMLGQSEAARDASAEALELCRRAGDTEGVAAYLGNLYEIDRYRGDGPAAAGWARDYAVMCESLDQPQAGRHWRRLARIVQDEPLVRLVAEVSGEEYELDELPRPLPDGSVRFLFRRNRLTLRPAQRLVEQGRKLAEGGHHEQALEAFRQACAADRYDPDPRSLTGLTLLYLGRYPEALEAYREAQRLGPGWFQVSSDAWLAAELAAGRLEPLVWKALMYLEDGQPPPEEVLTITEQSLRTYPGLAQLHLARGRALETLGQKVGAAEAFRAAVQHAGEPNLKTRALVQQALLEQEPERTRLLREAAVLDGHLLSGATARLLLGAG